MFTLESFMLYWEHAWKNDLKQDNRKEAVVKLAHDMYVADDEEKDFFEEAVVDALNRYLLENNIPATHPRQCPYCGSTDIWENNYVLKRYKIDSWNCDGTVRDFDYGETKDASEVYHVDEELPYHCNDCKQDFNPDSQDEDE